MSAQEQHLGTKGERGATLVFLGLVMLALLGVLALAIDLGMLYVGRSEAQRAADAAALAGAYVFMQSGCTGGGAAGTVPNCALDLTAQANARAQAEAAGNKNYVLGHQVSLTDAGSATPPTPCSTPGGGCTYDIPGGNISFTFPSGTEPQVTATVWLAHVPTIFAQVFHAWSANVSATATAEAFQGGDQTIQCPLPFAVPNCDTNTTDQLGTNVNCPPTTSGTQPKYFIDATGNIDTTAYGKLILLHYASTSGVNSGGTIIPSQWYLLAMGGQGAATLGNNIISCSNTSVSCNDVIPIETGSTSNGGVDHPVDILINAMGQSGKTPKDGMGQGQDTINIGTYPVGPYTITGGYNNPNPAFQNQIVTGASSSVQTVPIYSQACSNANDPTTCSNTTTLNSGTNGQGVMIVGYMQVFLVDAESPGNSGTADICNPTGQNWSNDSPVCAYVLQIVKCGSGPTVNTQWSPVPIRLIQGPTSQQ